MLTEKMKYGALAFGLASALFVTAFSALLSKFASLFILLTAGAAVFTCLSRESRSKPTLWYAGAIALFCLPMLDKSVSTLQILEALWRFYPVMFLLIGIAHFRHSVIRSGLSVLISRRMLTQGKGIGNSLRISVVTALLSILSAQGSIAIVCTALCQNVRNKLVIPRLTNRAMVSTMFMLPTTIASASVASVIPNLDGKAVALFGIPLALWALGGAIVPRLDALPVKAAATAEDGRKPYMLAAFFGLICALTYYLTRQMTLAFACAMSAGYLFELFAFPRQDRMRLLARESARSLDAIVPELGLLAASGLLIFTVERLDLLAHVPSLLMPFFSDIDGVLLVLIVLLPLMTVAGLHPLILFGVFFPLMQPAAFENTHLRYLAWTSMFVMANLLSPVSISSVVAATSIGANVRQTSYLANWKFCAGLMLFTYIYLSWLAG